MKKWIHEWKQELLQDEAHAMQFIVTVACLLVSVSIGYRYARHIVVEGWQLWTWLIALTVATATLLIGSGRPSLSLGRSWRCLATILLIAVLLRLLFLESVPGDLHVDEVGVADFSLHHVFPAPNETVNPFRSGPASQPTLFHYLLRLSMAVAGKSIVGLRLASVIAGTLGILATYILVATYHDRRTALISAGMMAAYHFHIHWSRIGLNNVWDTIWVPLMLAAFTWGWRQRWTGGAVLSGLALGLSQYFYAGSKIGLLLLIFIIWRFWRENRGLEGHTRRLVTYAGTTAVIGAIAAAPIVLHAIRDPVPFFERAKIVFAWKREAIVMVTGEPPDYWAYAWRQILQSLGAFTTVSDVTGFYGPGVPLLIGLAVPSFVIGLLWSIFKKQYVPVLWILLTVFLGGFLISDPPGSSHYVVAIPAIVWLTTMPLFWITKRGYPRLAIVLLLLIVITDLLFYFLIYAPSEPRDLIHAFPSLS
jgi:4-amino-4-deoxy-L-arabinose transferase-like glycosyltransferase